MMATYRNSFYDKDRPYSRPHFEADPNAEHYKGYEIHNYSTTQYHIVKDGVCIGMMGSRKACKNRIDNKMELV